MTHASFFLEEFALMVVKRHWVVLAYLLAKELLGLRIFPPGLLEGKVAAVDRRL